MPYHTPIKLVADGQHIGWVGYPSKALRVGQRFLWCVPTFSLDSLPWVISSVSPGMAVATLLK